MAGSLNTVMNRGQDSDEWWVIVNAVMNYTQDSDQCCVV